MLPAERGPTTIAIIGGGFSGVVTAVHLLRGGLGGPGRVLLINRSGRMARGVAYGTRTEAHVLNVAAGRMSALADDEDSFLRFVRARTPSVDGGSFVPRRLYGDYLGTLLEDAIANAAPGVVCERLVGEVIAIEARAEPLCADLTLADGRGVRADRVVLAVGNYAPADPPILDGRFYASERYVRDPWAPGALDRVSTGRPVLLIGTGLTLLDIALDLRARGLREPMHAISRRGLLPQAHRSPSVAPARTHRPPDIETGPPTARAYLRAVRRHVRDLAAEGVDWREVINSLRPITPQLWQRLGTAERARFLRHLRAYWEVHRHRAAPELGAALEQLLATGALVVAAGRIVDYAEEGEWVEVAVRLRATGRVRTFRVGSVINCTGPNTDTRRLRDPLIEDLGERHLVCHDALGLGIEVAQDGALLAARGEASRVLYYVGPFLKARDWEATAVPELRVHAQRLAETLRRSLSGGERSGSLRAC